MESIEAFRENIDEKVTTPASSHLFIVNKKSNQLEEENREIFDSVVAKLLHNMKRAIPDLKTALSFLCRK